MSTSPDPVYTPRPEPSAANLWVSVLGILGCFLIFGLVLVVAYVPARKLAEPVDLNSVDESDRWKYDNTQRRQKYVELRDRQAATATAYAWADKEARVVQLPITRAMELVVQEHGAKK